MLFGNSSIITTKNKTKSDMLTCRIWTSCHQLPPASFSRERLTRPIAKLPTSRRGSAKVRFAWQTAEVHGDDQNQLLHRRRPPEEDTRYSDTAATRDSPVAMWAKPAKPK